MIGPVRPEGRFRPGSRARPAEGAIVELFPCGPGPFRGARPRPPPSLPPPSPPSPLPFPFLVPHPRPLPPLAPLAPRGTPSPPSAGLLTPPGVHDRPFPPRAHPPAGRRGRDRHAHRHAARRGRPLHSAPRPDRPLDAAMGGLGATPGSARRRRSRRPPRLVRDPRLPGRRVGPSGRAGHHLPCVLDDEAHHDGRGADALRGRLLPARRPHREVPPRVLRDEGLRGRQRGVLRDRAARPPDHRARSHDPHFRPHLLLPVRPSGGRALSPARHRVQLQPRAAREPGRSHRRPAARLPARNALAVRGFDRRPRPPRRDLVRPAARRLPRRAHLRATRDGRHRLSRARGRGRPLRLQLRPARRGRARPRRRCRRKPLPRPPP